MLFEPARRVLMLCRLNCSTVGAVTGVFAEVKYNKVDIVPRTGGGWRGFNLALVAAPSFASRRSARVSHAPPPEGQKEI